MSDRRPATPADCTGCRNDPFNRRGGCRLLATARVVPKWRTPTETGWQLDQQHHGHIPIWPMSQKQVVACGRHYRLDFVLRALTEESLSELVDSPYHPLIAIEFDGHAFHEKTAAQVTSRNQRDRDLSDAGWTVWHFSGSEFNRDPKHLVESEIYDRAHLMFSAAYRLMRQELKRG